MIKVVKRGEIENTKSFIICETCDCEFYADNPDMHKIIIGGMIIPAINCPTCGKEIFEWQGGNFKEWTRF